MLVPTAVSELTAQHVLKPIIDDCKFVDVTSRGHKVMQSSSQAHLTKSKICKSRCHGVQQSPRHNHSGAFVG